MVFNFVDGIIFWSLKQQENAEWPILVTFSRCGISLILIQYKNASYSIILMLLLGGIVIFSSDLHSLNAPAPIISTSFGIET